MKKVKFALAAFAFVAAIGGAVSTKAVAGPQDDCENLPAGASCNTQINEVCCSFFINDEPVDELRGRLQQQN